ncbi:MAG: leucine-rich repeat protein [Clostridia bacterium]|nr:leucine-rich repeat protein [Clostridia bacterium]
MRSNMTHMIIIALAILFAMALALTVSLICLSYVDADYGQTLPDAGDPLPSPEDTGTLPPADTTAPPDDPLPPAPLDNGLAYASNGNGTCTLTGLGTCTDAYIIIPTASPAGDVVTSIAARAFYGCTFVTAIGIPSTVSSIGSLAFANCPALTYLSVDAANPFYCDIDGVLYTSDGRALLLYPPQRVGTHLTISAVTTEIMDMAFYDCAYLTHVYYAGSAEEWERILIGTKNYSLIAASKTFYGNGQ